MSNSPQPSQRNNYNPRKEDSPKEIPAKIHDILIVPPNWHNYRIVPGIPTQPEANAKQGWFPPVLTRTKFIPQSMRPESGQVVKVLNYVFKNEEHAKKFVHFVEDRSSYGVDLKIKKDQNSGKTIVTLTGLNVVGNNAGPDCGGGCNCMYGCPRIPTLFGGADCPDAEDFLNNCNKCMSNPCPFCACCTKNKPFNYRYICEPCGPNCVPSNVYTYINSHQ